MGNDAASGKTETLFELLEPLMAEGQKVLVFSQFVQMLRILEKECAARQIPTHILTGQTKNRQEVVNTFQNDPNAAVFLLSLRAAGTGLNLTTASYVVLTIRGGIRPLKRRPLTARTASARPRPSTPTA